MYRVGVTDASHIFARCSVFHGQSGFINHFTSSLFF
jgi:hypothetical protein